MAGKDGSVPESVDSGRVLSLIEELGRKRKSSGSSTPLFRSSTGTSARGTPGDRRHGQDITPCLLVDALETLSSSFHATVAWDLAEVALADMNEDGTIDQSLYVRPICVLVLWLSEKLRTHSAGSGTTAVSLPVACNRRLVIVLQGLTRLLLWAEVEARRDDFAFPIATKLVHGSEATDAVAEAAHGTGDETPTDAKTGSVRVVPVVALLCGVLRGLVAASILVARALE